MMKKLKSLIGIMMVFSMLLAFVAIPAAADEAGTDNLPFVNSEDLISKTAEYDPDSASYTVSLTVPGQDGEQLHDEVIIMVDASYSGDRYWNDMRNAIYSIGSAVLNGKGNTQLTLMSFAMCGHTVLSHIKSTDELRAALSGSEPGSLLYGLSSTNCEVGFTWVDAYLNEHDDTLNQAEVIYISDGGANTHEIPWAYDKWRERTWTNFSDSVLVSGTLSEELNAVEAGAKPSNSLIEVFGSDYDLTDLAHLEEIALNSSYEQKAAVLDSVYAEVYAAAGLTLGEAYPVSVVERAFVSYDNANGTFVQYYFYYTAFGRKFSNARDRATDAANTLLKNEKLVALHMVDTSAVDAWINNIDKTNGKLTVTQSSGIAGLIDAIEHILHNLSMLPFNDVVVTDYMSKWVDLDQSTISIVDDTMGKEIWNSTDGWLITENRPTDHENPVIIEVVDPADYALGGADVLGNTNGDIYKITWYVKDGAMLRSDHYHLEYVVELDTEEQGFLYNMDYPANGDTTVAYIDEDGNPQEEEVVVPEIVEIAPAEYIVTAKKNLTNGTPVAGAFSFTMAEATPNGTVKEGGNTYTAKNGADGSVAFPAIEHLLLGDYYYIVTEDIPDDADGITYDATVYLVHLSVEYDSGKYSVTPSYSIISGSAGDAEDSSPVVTDGIVFVNAYPGGASGPDVTGDNLLVYLALEAISLAAIVIFVVYKKKADCAYQ